VLARSVRAELPVEPPPIRLRVEWGGGDPRAWRGRLEVVRPAATWRQGSPAVGDLDWRLLASSPAAGRGMRREGNSLFIAADQPQAEGGVELLIADWQSARLRVSLQPAAAGDLEPGIEIDQPVATLLGDQSLHQLDTRGNRLTIGPAPGELLRLQLVPRLATEPAAAGDGWRPGQPVRLLVHPLMPARASGFGRVDLRLVLADQRTGEQLLSHTLPLAPPADDAEEAAAAAVVRAWPPAYFDFAIPDDPGVYRLSLEAIERGRLRWSRKLSTSSLEFPVVPAGQSAAVEDRPWRLVYRLDPGSPRLHERLRRLPGQAVESVSAMRRLSLPAMPMPSLTRAAGSLPTLSLPKVPLPELPAFPKVPAIDSLVPTIGGLLATGDSTVEPHALGAMLRLPPGGGPDAPTWEGIVVAEAVPGLPHAVEIDYPSDQRATVAVTVLERDPAGGPIVVRYDGGFHVPRPSAAAPPTLRRHRFVFWPRTAAPVIVLSNPAAGLPATVGEVRVLAGPKRLGRSPDTAGTPAKKIFGVLPRRQLAAAGTVPSGPAAGWVDWYDEVTEATSWLASEGANGVAAEVYAGGAGLWRSRATVAGPPWDGGGHAPSLAWNGGDRLDLLRQVCRGAGLDLLPTLKFDGLLPRLESRLGDPAAATGLVCIGRDGRPRDPAATTGGRHYNILDPRVQDAVADTVAELVGRLPPGPDIAGIAVVMPADGWMHLPGIAWGLDDRTFARFLRETGQDDEPSAAGPGRFAARAAAVEGRLREAWLRWRAAEVAGLHTRLAEIVAAADPGWNYAIMPTTLLFAGEAADRFAVSGPARPPAADVLWELGLDPGRLTQAENAIYVSARLHAAADELAVAAAAAAANCAPGVAAWARRARRRGLVLLERPQPLSLDTVISHGPLGGGELATPGRFHAVAGDPARQRSLVSGLAAGAVEFVVDHALRWAAVDEKARRARLALLTTPAGSLHRVADLPAEFPVWLQQQGNHCWLLAGNASGMPARIELRAETPLPAARDLVTGEPVATSGGRLAFELSPGELRALRVAGRAVAQELRAVVRFDEQVVRTLAEQVADLRQREAVLRSPPAIPVLDNPGFDLPSIGHGITGWELVAPAAGAAELVETPSPTAAPGVENLAVRFSSTSDLATIRSNPFPPPATGRASVAVWLRLPKDTPQPPLRVAVEGLSDGEDYYRFAPVGGAAGGRPLATEWTRFVLQVGDLPTDPTESLRLRFDMLGPGVVEIDEISVFDLVFADSRRAEVAELLDQLEHDLATGATANLLAALDSYWPRFLREAVSDQQASAAAERRARQAARREATKAEEQTAEQPASIIDRVRSWWR